MIPEEKLLERGITLPPPAPPGGSYIPWRLAGNLLYIAGQGPRRPDGTLVTGKLGRDVTVDQGYEAARLVGIQLLAVAKSALGDLSRIEAVVKLLGMVNATPEFAEHPNVINGCSDLLVDILGDAGRHARSAVGMVSLPHGMSVEVEAILLVSPA